MKKVGAITALLLLMLVFVLVLRTMMFTAEQSPGEALVSIEVDASRISAHMSESIAFETVSTGDSQTQNYEAFDRFIEWVGQTYPEVQSGLSLKLLADYTMLYTWQGSNPALKPILLTGHYDVVPVVAGSEGDWTYPPFSGAIVDGYVWGRGAMDDKSGVIVMLEAATLLLSEGFVPQRTIYFSFGHDEEVGGNQGAAGVTEYLKANGIQLAWSIDEGSFIFDGVMPGLETPIASINVAEKGIMTLDLVAHGPGGHSSVPESETAVDILAQALVNLREHPLPGGLEGISLEAVTGVARTGSFMMRLAVANKWLFGGLIEQLLAKAGSLDAMLRTTTAPTILRAGVKTNVIPPTATAAVNFRLHPRDTPESVRAHVIAAIDDERVEVKFRSDGMASLASEVSSTDSEAYQLIGKVAKQVFGDVTIVPGLTLGATDSKHYSQVADDAYRFQYMVVGPEDLAGFHGTNERVSISNLSYGTGAYYLLMKEAAGGG